MPESPDATAAGGQLVDTPTRLVVRTPVPQPPYNVVLRFADEGGRPLTEQVREVWSDFGRRGVAGAWLVGPSSPPPTPRTGCGWRRGGTASSRRSRRCSSGSPAGVFGVVTTPEGRGQGLAGLLTVTALRAARDDGATLATLQSTPMARTLYRRLGFRDVADFEVWAAPDAMSL